MSDEETDDGTSSDEESDEEEVEQNENSNRTKRSTEGIAWCGIETETDNGSTSWPPDLSTSNQMPMWKNLRATRPGNPHYGPRMQLFCRTNWMLAIYSGNDVRGSVEDQDPYTFFELSYAGVPGHVKLQCLENNLYLGMKKSGRLYGEPDSSKETTVFIESLQGSYNIYLSRKWAHLGYYIGLRRSGKVKKGPKTAFGQKAIQFLPRRRNIQTP